MKSILIAALIICMHAVVALGQSQATEGRVEYQKGEKAAAVIELPYNADLVAGAIREDMLKRGFKEDRIKGFQVFRGTRLTPTDGEVVDLYFKVDRRTRRDANNAVVYLIVGRPNENVTLRQPGDVHRIAEGKTFLNQLTPAIEAHKLQVGISQQDEALNKEEKRLKKLQDDQAALERKIQGLQDKLEENRREQQTQTDEINKQRTALRGLQVRQNGTEVSDSATVSQPATQPQQNAQDTNRQATPPPPVPAEPADHPAIPQTSGQ